MWPNKGWVYNDGNVPNNNINQNSLPALPFADPDDTEQVLVPMSSMQAQQFIQSRTGEGYSNFQSPLSVSDRLMFQQDQVAPNAMTQFPQAQHNTQPATAPTVQHPTQISARGAGLSDAELRTHLVTREHQASSKLAPSTAQGKASNQLPAMYQQLTSPLKVLNTPATSIERARDIDELIAQHSNLDSATYAKMDPDKGSTNPTHPYLPRSSEFSVPPSKALPATAEGTHTSHLSTSEMPDGSVLDRPVAAKAMQLPMTTEACSYPTQPDLHGPETPANRRARGINPGPRIADSPLVFRPSSRVSELQRSPSILSRLEKSLYYEQMAQASKNNNRDVIHGSDVQPNMQPPSQPRVQGSIMQDTNNPQNQDGSTAPTHEPISTALQELLHHDGDLRDWLEITNYFNIQHRNDLLQNRREIRKLDERKNTLVAKFEAKLRAPTLLAPHSPDSKTIQAEVLVGPENRDSETPHNQTASKKRSHSEVEEAHHADAPTKTRCLGERVTRGYESYRPKRDDPSHYRDRGRYPSRTRYHDTPPRGRSRERDVSPNRRPHDRRFPSPRRDIYDRDARHPLPPTGPRGNGNRYQNQQNNQNNRRSPPSSPGGGKPDGLVPIDCNYMPGCPAQPNSLPGGGYGFSRNHRGRNRESKRHQELDEGVGIFTELGSEKKARAH